MKTIRALVADKSPALRRWYIAALRRIASDVVECESGWDVLLQLSQEPSCDLVVASKSLPGLDGARVLSLLRAADVQVPFVLVAPFSDGAVRALVSKVPGATLIDDALDSVRLSDAAEALLASRPRPAQAEQVSRALSLYAGSRAPRRRTALG
jgi:DNA-binding response OmpR family regulator